MCNKQLTPVYSLIDKITNNGYEWSSKRNKPVKVVGIYQVDAVTTLIAHVEEIMNRIDAIQSTPQA